MPATPSRDHPLTGGCLCGAVRFEVTGPFETAGYCHCTRCQRRTGTGSSLNARVARASFRIVAGADAVRAWRPQDGVPKAYCVACGAHLFSGDLDGERPIAVRFGAFDGDPGVRPEWHQWVSSAAPWEQLPDDGLPRYAESRLS